MVGVITFTAGFLSFGESAKAAMPVQKTKWVVEKRKVSQLLMVVGQLYWKEILVPAVQSL